MRWECASSLETCPANALDSSEDENDDNKTETKPKSTLRRRRGKGAAGKGKDATTKLVVGKGRQPERKQSDADALEPDLRIRRWFGAFHPQEVQQNVDCMLRSSRIR